MTATLKTIHVACRQLGLDPDTRRALQLQVVGKASLAEMSEDERVKVLDALKARGFRLAPNAAKKGYRRAASRGDVRFCHVLWGKLFRSGAVAVPGAAGLNAFIRARFEKSWGAATFDVDGMKDWRQIATVIEALKGMCKRAGVAIDP